jgi:hypothetical protein
MITSTTINSIRVKPRAGLLGRDKHSHLKRTF